MKCSNRSATDVDDISLLGLDLAGYVSALHRGQWTLAALVEEAGLQCPGCRAIDCVRLHAVRHRKRVSDLTTGEVFEDVPILRVRFCCGPTVSLTPAFLWRGRCTVGSVLQAVIWRLQEGTAAASERISQQGDGETVPDESTLRRWSRQVRSRLVGSALVALGPVLEVSWSSAFDEAAQLEDLLDRLTAPVLLDFRAVYGHAVLDRSPRPIALARSSARRVAGRLPPAPPPNPPSDLLKRGTWSSPNRRGPPGPSDKEA